jgi:lipopolysaccharide transport system permease protein
LRHHKYTSMSESESNIKIYLPSNHDSAFSLFKSVFQGLRKGHDLGFRLFKRDLKASFEGSLFGYFWIIFPPLASAAVWIMLNQQRLIKVTDTGMSYIAFALLGTTFWSIFSESINKPTQRYKSAMSMMVKLNFPREAIAISSLYDLTFNAILKLIVLTFLLSFTDEIFSVKWLLLIPLCLGVIVVGISFGLLISPFGILFSDITRIINLALPFLMYLSPIVYAIQPDSLLGKFQYLNPITPWVEHARWCIGNLTHHGHSMLIIWLVISFLLSLTGLMMLKVALPIIVERSGS